MVFEISVFRLKTGGQWLTLFEGAGWPVELVEHRKGHMIPTEHHEMLKNWLENLV